MYKCVILARCILHNNIHTQVHGVLYSRLFTYTTFTPCLYLRLLHMTYLVSLTRFFYFCLVLYICESIYTDAHHAHQAQTTSNYSSAEF